MEAVATARPRRSQAERSASTRARLLDATVECLFDLGYARTSTPEIARRAGLSRGAQLHHFPTKAELVTTAVEHLFQQRHQEFVDAFARLPEGVDLHIAAIDLLWQKVSGPTFYAWLELVVAARTDPELRDAVAGMSQRFIQMVEETFRRLMPPPSNDPGLSQVAPLFAFALLQGLAVQRMDGRNDPRVDQVIDALKQIAALVRPVCIPTLEEIPS